VLATVGPDGVAPTTGVPGLPVTCSLIKFHSFDFLVS